MTSGTLPIIVLQFAFATLLPVLLSVVLVKLEERTAFGSMSYLPKQLIIGVLFGLVAVFGTEVGIYTHDATMNVRDAAPLIAGLYFGGPAGIIAGVIGGVERWFAALWGRGMFTRVACSTATFLAGFYAAIQRRFVFDNEKPSRSLAMTVGVTAEVLHMLLVFLTNLEQTERAVRVVMACSIPMITCNALSVVLAGVALAFLRGEEMRHVWETPEISQKVRLGMLGVIIVGLAGTVTFVTLLQTSLDDTNTRTTLAIALRDTENDIRDASDDNLLWMAREASKHVASVDAVTNEELQVIGDMLDLSHLYVIDENGIVVKSTDEESIGFDMASGAQSAAFLCLLPGGTKQELVQRYQPMARDESQWIKFAGVSIEGGFLQVSYDTQLFTEDLTSLIKLTVSNRHVGRDGLFVVLTDRDTLVGKRSGVNVGRRDIIGLSDFTAFTEEGEVFMPTLNGQPYYAMYDMTEGLRVVAMLPASEVRMQRYLTILAISFMEVLVFSALFLAIYVLIRQQVVKSIWRVNERLGQITAGDLEVEVDVRDSVEFASLSDDINATVGALRDAIAAESARIEDDLRTAKAIQSSALPRTFPPFPDIKEFDIYALMSAAREVGGDFYDFFLVGDHTVAFFIADVSGKGIPAALFMMASKTELEHHIKSGMELAEAVRSANWNLCQNNNAGMFVTVWAAMLDYKTGKLTYVNAGHNPPLLRHEGNWQWIKNRSGLFLGTFETATYRSTTIQLVSGDELLLYTDGVNEAFSAEGEEYGNERLEAFLSTRKNLHPRMLVDTLRSDVRRWSQGAEQSDDVTMLCLEYGTPPDFTGVITVPASNEGFQELMRRSNNELWHIQCPMSVSREIDEVLRALFVNARAHERADDAEQARVELSYMYDTDPHSLTLGFTDWGEPYDLYEEGGVTPELAAAIAKMDDFAFVRDEDSNVVAFRKVW